MFAWAVFGVVSGVPCVGGLRLPENVSAGLPNPRVLRSSASWKQIGGRRLRGHHTYISWKQIIQKKAGSICGGRRLRGHHTHMYLLNTNVVVYGRGCACAYVVSRTDWTRGGGLRGLGLHTNMHLMNTNVVLQAGRLSRGGGLHGQGVHTYMHLLNTRQAGRVPRGGGCRGRACTHTCTY